MSTVKTQDVSMFFYLSTLYSKRNKTFSFIIHSSPSEHRRFSIDRMKSFFFISFIFILQHVLIESQRYGHRPSGEIRLTCRYSFEKFSPPVRTSNVSTHFVSKSTVSHYYLFKEQPMNTPNNKQRLCIQAISCFYFSNSYRRCNQSFKSMTH